MDDKRNNPGDDTLEHDDPDGPGRAELPLDRGDCRDARRVEQAERPERRGRQWRQHRIERCRAEKDRQRRNDALLGHEARDQRRRNAPVTEAQRRKDWRD